MSRLNRNGKGSSEKILINGIKEELKLDASSDFLGNS